MASIIPGYEYDIFISYRQKDNKHDGWVTEFVNNLKGELESTFKEEITVYFDINTHDGLLETHDVDASLKDKLKCLICIPIISLTYCDPKSFAWEREFKVFVEQASKDQFGLKVKLPNGNVANRVLPVRIHDLDIADIRLFESTIGGVLRSIDFVYKETGVNRQLRSKDDDVIKNPSQILYRDQVNKVAHAIKDIIESLKVAQVHVHVKENEIQVKESLKKNEPLIDQQVQQERGESKWQVISDKSKPEKAGKILYYKNHNILVPGVLFIIAIFVIIFLLLNHRSKVKWAKEVALTEIEKCINDANFTKAFVLVQRAEKYLSNEIRFKELESWVISKVTILTDPPGADVYIREYSDIEGKWEKLGRTPIDSMKMPNHLYYLMKIEKAGFDDLLAVMHTQSDTLFRKLFKAGTTPPGMVYVEGLWVEAKGFIKENYGFFIDRYEVTNKQFKEFVDNGGYRNSQYWKNEFVKNGKTLTLQQALTSFVDKTERPGPATWEGGDYPDGQDNYPVTGVSWYEAAAYAEYAAKSLPTTDHWAGAAEFYNYWFSNLGAKIFPLSNFNGKSSEPVGKNKGINCFGAFDMAGNVREWCWNETESGRVVRGGGWDDPVYMYNTESQLPPFDRSPKNGFRCVRYIDNEKIPVSALRQIKFIEARDFSKEKPVPENIFRIYKNQFLYDKTPLDAIIEKRDERSEDWIVDKIAFNAAYGNERMIAYLFLPKNGSPPFQTIMYFPGAYARGNTSDLINYRYATWNIDYILKGGRAVMYPVYKGTFERNDGTLEQVNTDQSHQYTEWLIKWVKDLSRSIDYLETRPDIDCSKLGYYGISWGGALGGIISAVEERLAVSTIVTGGFNIHMRPLPEADALNYVPRIRIPVLMLSGKYDVFFPPETAVKPFFNLLGTPPDDKRLIFYETDHFMHPGDIIKETLNWLDRYLGPVK